MRWPWPRRKDRAADQARADAALATSRRQRAEASERAQEARRSAALWRRWREDNHFAEGFRRALEE